MEQIYIDNLSLQEKLDKLNEERDRREPLGWNDYEWRTGHGDYVAGKISILEEILQL